MTIACCFRLHTRSLHLGQVMKEEVFTITNGVYLKKNCLVRLLTIFELRKLIAKSMHLNCSKSLATGCYSQEE